MRHPSMAQRAPPLHLPSRQNAPARPRSLPGKKPRPSFPYPMTWIERIPGTTPHLGAS